MTLRGASAMLVACLVVVAPASWTARAGSAAEAGAEVPCVVLVPAENSQSRHPGVIRINSDAELQHAVRGIDGGGNVNVACRIDRSKSRCNRFTFVLRASRYLQQRPCYLTPVLDIGQEWIGHHDHH